MSLPMSDDLNAHYDIMIKAITDGLVVPFLGAGANLCDRPEDLTWSCRQRAHLPNGSELAAHLAGKCGGYPLTGRKQDLARVSQYITVMMGLGRLYEELHLLLDVDYPPTSLHRFFATLPAALRDRGYPRAGNPLRQQLVIVTTNYDDLLERAFQTAGESFHLVSYMAEGRQRGKFLHQPPDGRARLIENPNRYRGLFDQRPVILKIHGAVDRVNAEGDSFVITEDHYFDYLTRTDISNLIPVPLSAKLKRSHLLFLGHGLRDWNLRVILHRIWGEALPWKSWAIQRDPDHIEREFWRQRGVDILYVNLGEYINALSERMQALPPA